MHAVRQAAQHIHAPNFTCTL